MILIWSLCNGHLIHNLDVRIFTESLEFTLDLKIIAITIDLWTCDLDCQMDWLV